MGDDDNEYLGDKYELIFDFYDNYGHGKEFKDLLNNYKHIGSAKAINHRKHHFNIMRWPRLLDALYPSAFKHFWYFDSDTLICQDLSKVDISDSYLYNINGISGCAMYIGNKYPLKKLCNIIYKYRKDPGFLDYHRWSMEMKKKEGKGYNLCDMSFIRVLKEQNPDLVKDLAWPNYYTPGEPSIFDWNINTSTADHVPHYPLNLAMDSAVRKKKIIYRSIAGTGLRAPYFIKAQPDYSDTYIRANTLNMSWTNPELFNSVVKSLGL